MKKVAGRIKLELSQYRDLEAFAQFGSDLDADTQRTLARGERLVETLNQNEREPLAVEDQVVQIYAATNGFLDRLNVERVGEFLAELTERDARPARTTLREKIAGGDWSEETQKARQGRGRRVRRGLRLRPRRGGPAARRRRAAAPRARGAPREEQPAAAERGLAARGTAIAMASQRDVKNRIASVKNIQKITRAMEMVAAARLRRAEQRIAALRPYAEAMRRMTRQAAQAAGAEAVAAAAARRAREHEQRRRCCSSPATAAWRAPSTRRSSAPACALAAELGERGPQTRLVRDRAARRLLADLPRARAERRLHRLHRPPRLRRRARDRRRPDRRLHRRRARPRRDHLQRATSRR